MWSESFPVLQTQWGFGLVRWAQQNAGGTDSADGYVLTVLYNLCAANRENWWFIRFVIVLMTSCQWGLALSRVMSSL